MTVQAANRNNNQHYASGIKSKFSGGASDNAKHPVGQRFDAAQQKVHINFYIKYMHFQQ